MYINLFFPQKDNINNKSECKRTFSYKENENSSIGLVNYAYDFRNGKGCHSYKISVKGNGINLTRYCQNSTEATYLQKYDKVYLNVR